MIIYALVLDLNPPPCWNMLTTEIFQKVNEDCQEGLIRLFAYDLYDGGFERIDVKQVNKFHELGLLHMG